MQPRAHRALLLCFLVAGAHLADNLLLADHHGIQARGHAHHMFGSRVGVADIEVAAQLFGAHAGNLSKHVDNVLNPGVESVGDGVHLQPVTGGDDHGLGQRRLFHQRGRSVVLDSIVHTQPFKQRDRRGTVGHAHNKHTHSGPPDHLRIKQKDTP